MVFTFLFFNRDSIQATCSLPSQVSVACPAKPMSKGGELTAADSSSIGVGLAFSFGSCGYTICYLMKIENLGSCGENSTLFEKPLQITRKKIGSRPVSTACVEFAPGAWSVLGAVSMLAVVLVAVNMLPEPQICQGKPLRSVNC